MTHKTGSLLLMAVVGGFLATVPSCREPTQVQLIVRTTTSCSELSGVIIDVGADAATVEQRASSNSPNQSWRAQTSETQCDPKTGEIGRIFLAPGAGTAAVLIRAGNKTDPATCVAPDYKGCIVARRRIGYVLRTTLTLTVNLDLSCVNVPCGVLSTCDQGRCIDSNASLCENDTCDPDKDASVPQDERDAGVDAPRPLVDASFDAPVDAPVDTGFDAPILEPQPPPGPGLTSKVSHTCARLSGGRWKCWGYNAGGQLGLGDFANRGDGMGEMGSTLPELDLGSGRVALDVVAGGLHTCARLDGGQVKCWGANEFGQLGLGDNLERGSEAAQMGNALPVVDLGTGRVAVQLALGFHHTCARLDDGNVKCWGQNVKGQLGLDGLADGGRSPSQINAPDAAVDLGPSVRATHLVAGYDHTCALLSDGSVKCWGAGGAQLGLGDKQDRGVRGPMGVSLLRVDLGMNQGQRRKALELWASSYQTCARLDDASVTCWGANASLQLGLPSIPDSGFDLVAWGDKPEHMGDKLGALNFGGSPVTLLAIGSAHVCALLPGATLKCWGKGVYGQLASGAAPWPSVVSLSMAPAMPGEPPRTPTYVVAGYEHSCATFSNGEVSCWGNNAFGQLGVGDKNHRGVQVPVAL